MTNRSNVRASRRFFVASVITTLAAVACSSGANPAPASSPAAKPAAAPKAVETPPPAKARRPYNEMSSPDYGIQVFLWGRGDTTDRDLKLAKDAGFRWVKQMFQWNYIEGKAKGQFEWNEPDRIVTAVEQHGLQVLARMDFAPMWARGDGADPNLDGAPEQPKDFGEFLSRVARRYKGRIGAYQIWNEPNLAIDWNGVEPDPEAYTELLKTAYTAIKEQDPAATVISAGLSPTTAGAPIAMPDMEFLRGMYRAGAKQYFDMLGVHAAGFRSAPELDPAVVARDPKATNEDPSPVEAKRVYAFRHVEDLRKIMVEQGDDKKQVTVLEFGWTSDNRPGSPYRWHAVTEEQKAKYIVDAFEYAKANWRPWIGLMSTIYIPDKKWTEQNEQWHWSITNPDGTVRPAYEAIKAMPK